MKNITENKDLAFFGGKPAFENALHVGRPNIGDRELFMKYANAMFDRNWFSNNGPIVQEFEAALAKELNVKHCIAMCNGTLALEIAIRALDLKGEVIVPSYTFVATAHSLQWQEITPVFADIDPDTHTLNLESVKKMITPRTTGILGVHLWGRPCDVDGLQDIADEHGLELMFDAAHAFSSGYKGQKIGNFGRCEVFSFHATKFFNSFEGGAIATNDDELANKFRLMQNFGFSGVDNVIYPGTNGKMTEVAAAMGLTNLSSLDYFLNINKVNYDLYKSGVSKIEGIEIIDYDENTDNNYQYIVIEIAQGFPVERDRIVEILQAENVLARKYFWPSCHNMEPYRSLQPHAGLLLPNTEKVAEQVIVLPTGTSMNEESISFIISLLGFLSEA